MTNPAQPSSLFWRNSMMDTANPTLVIENSPDQAADSDDRAAIAAFNSFYKEFAGSPIENGDHRRHPVEWSPALAKLALAGASGLVATLSIAHAIAHDAAAPATYTYRESGSPTTNPSSKASISPTVTRPALSEPEAMAISPRRVQPTQNLAAEVPQLPQLVPPESLAVTPLRLETANLTAAAPESSPSQSTSGTQPISAARNSAEAAAKPQLQASASSPVLEPEQASAVPPAPDASPAPPAAQPIEAGAQPQASPSIASSTPTDRPSLASNPSLVPEDAAADLAGASLIKSRLPLESKKSEKRFDSASLSDFLNIAQKGTPSRILPLSDRAAAEAAQASTIGSFRVVRLPLLDYQSVWLNLQAQIKASLPAPSTGFVDYQQKIIALPTR